MSPIILLNRQKDRTIDAALNARKRPLRKRQLPCGSAAGSAGVKCKLVVSQAGRLPGLKKGV